MAKEFPTRKDQIIHYAEKMFSEMGYGAAGMRDIAADVGIEAASIYAHFSSKQDMLRTICFNIAERLITSIEEVNDIYFNAEEKLKMAVKSHVGVITANTYGARVFLYEWKHLAEPSLSEFKALRNKYEEAFTTILKDGETENLFHESDKKFAVLTILSSVNWVCEWYKPEGKLKPEEIAARITDFVLKGLKK